MSARAGESARNGGGGEGGIQYSVRKSGIVGVQVGHDTRVDRYFCGPLKDLTRRSTFGQEIWLDVYGVALRGVGKSESV